MKFACDKCKTRYSIGEDRVRGKILKIRCKNCGNVITVREGMDLEAAAEAPADRRKPITAAPATGSVAAAKAATPPAPPTIDQEWYVSIDGVQSGPLTLSEAQRWVTNKPFEADLHCWSEGFEDWLSVDKVSHFRNLRKPRAPRAKTVPPPIPPKPLFAATMAAIEKDASAFPPSQASAPAPRAIVPAAAPRSALPAPARVNGTGSAPVPQTAKGTGSGQVPAIPARTSSPSGRFNAQKSASHAALAAAFEPADDADSRTQLEAPAFSDLAAKPGDPFAAFNAKPEPSVQQVLESDDDLSIGEVSRVVKLTDLVPKPKPLPSTSQTGAVARYTASQPKLSPTELGMNVDPALLSHTGPAPDESIVARSFAQRHRRGMLALLAVAILLVAGVVGLLIYITSKQNDEIGGGLGRTTRTIDTSRPEDIVRRQLPKTPETGSATVAQQRPKWTGTRPNTGNQTPQVEDDPKGLSLRSTEIEEMAAKQGEGTKRCYMRAQKGALGFEIAEIKKIEVTLTIGKDGLVSSVGLSSHAQDAFGQCLIARVKAWRFRESPNGGTFRISLAFSS